MFHIDDEDTFGLGVASSSNNGIYRLQGVQSTSQLGNYTTAPTTTMTDRQIQRHSAGDSSSNALKPPTSATSNEQQQQMQQPMMGNDMFLTEGSQLLQWQYMQQYHQAQMAHFQHHQQQQQHQQPHMLKKSHSSTHLRQSGMELMAQLEHDKAEAKRQKPKLNPSHAKIEGLLAHVPEPGSHSISFQQHQQQRGNRQHRVSTAMMMNHQRSVSPGPPMARPASHIMMNPQQLQQQPLMPMVGGPYTMYPYYAPYPQQQQQPIPPRSTSPMDMSRR